MAKEQDASFKEGEDASCFLLLAYKLAHPFIRKYPHREDDIYSQVHLSLAKLTNPRYIKKRITWDLQDLLKLRHHSYIRPYEECFYENPKYTFEEIISPLSKLQRQILILLYLHNCTFGEAAKQLNYSRSRIWRLHHEALEKLRCMS